jgi:hypothetical protein
LSKTVEEPPCEGHGRHRSKAGAKERKPELGVVALDGPLDVGNDGRPCSPEQAKTAIRCHELDVTRVGPYGQARCPLAG